MEWLSPTLRVNTAYVDVLCFPLSFSRVLLQHSTDTRTALALPDLSPWKPKHFDLPRPATADLLHVRHSVPDAPVKEHLMVVLLYCTFPYTSLHRTTLHRPPSTDRHHVHDAISL